jgi:hypothetical protein
MHHCSNSFRDVLHDLHESGLPGPLFALEIIQIASDRSCAPKSLAAISARSPDGHRLDQSFLSQDIGQASANSVTCFQPVGIDEFWLAGVSSGLVGDNSCFSFHTPTLREKTNLRFLV